MDETATTLIHQLTAVWKCPTVKVQRQTASINNGHTQINHQRSSLLRGSLCVSFGFGFFFGQKSLQVKATHTHTLSSCAIASWLATSTIVEVNYRDHRSCFLCVCVCVSVSINRRRPLISRGHTAHSPVRLAWPLTTHSKSAQKTHYKG